MSNDPSVLRVKPRLAAVPCDEPQPEVADRGAKLGRSGPTSRSLRAVALSDLFSRNFPQRQMLLDPWLPESSLAMVYGPRGVGKSFLTLSVALAVAGGGGLLGWKGSSPKSVLYVDGEMRGDDIKSRAQNLIGQLPEDMPLRFLARDLSRDPIPPLNEEKLRNAIDALAEQHQAKLIILDNLSTLWSGDENEAQAWGPVQDWLIGVRSKGRSVLIVHHAGKSGGQRGTSRREDALDVVLALRRPESCGTGTAASFNVAFEKSRSAYGLDMQPFFASLDSSLKSGLGGWQRVAARVDDKMAEIVALHLQGFSDTEIAKKLGTHKSTVGRKLKVARERGLFEAADGEERDTPEDA